MLFTEELYTTERAIWEASQNHPFVKELAAGTLSPEIFRYYLLQDRWYLEEFQEIHRRAAELTREEETKTILKAGVDSLDSAEIAVRETFFRDLDITSSEIAETQIAPNCYYYVSHMYRCLYHDGIAAAVAALLPCYWLYQEIGQTLIAQGSPNPMYQKWIATYESPEYDTAVQRMKKITNQLAAATDEAGRKKMHEAFRISSICELNFWQMAYEQQTWEK